MLLKTSIRHGDPDQTMEEIDEQVDIFTEYFKQI